MSKEIDKWKKKKEKKERLGLACLEWLPVLGHCVKWDRMLMAEPNFSAIAALLSTLAQQIAGNFKFPSNPASNATNLDVWETETLKWSTCLLDSLEKIIKINTLCWHSWDLLRSHWQVARLDPSKVPAAGAFEAHLPRAESPAVTPLVLDLQCINKISCWDSITKVWTMNLNPSSRWRYFQDS